MTYRFHIEADGPADMILQMKLKEMLAAYQEEDQKVVLLPWLINKRNALPLISDPDQLTKMKIADVRHYADKLRPTNNTNCWFKMALTYSIHIDHLTNANSSNTTGWFDRQNCVAWPCSVQGSDNPKTIGDFVYSGTFVDTV